MVRIFTLTFITLFSCCSVFAQNYQPLYSNSLQLFYEDGYIGDMNNLGSNMWGTRIDYSQVDINGDTILQNYVIARDTALEISLGDPYTERCVWIDAPNWSGEKVVVQSDGTALFFNEFADTISIKFSEPIGTEWVAYKYHDGSMLKARVDDVMFVDDGWIQDSVKSIVFTHLDSAGSVIGDGINNKTIELYRTKGFRKALDFVKFPTDTFALKQLDLNVINGNKVWELNTQVGDLVTIKEGCEKPYQDDFSYIRKTIEVLEVVYNSPTSVSLRVKENSEGAYRHLPSNQTTYLPVSTLTEWRTFNGDDDFSLIEGAAMPLENGFGLIYYESGDEFCPSSVFFQSGFYPSASGLFFSSQNNCYQGHIPFEDVSGRTYRYIPFIGRTHYATYTDSYYGWVDEKCYKDYTYFRTNGYECGTYYAVGINETQVDLSQVSLYPNPAADYINLTLPQGNYSNASVNIYDLTGRLVLSSTLFGKNERVDIQSLSPGSYFATVEIDGNRKSLKLVKGN